MGKWKTPEDLKYAKSDEWVRISGDTATLGISDYAQDALNDIVYVELPEVGDKIAAGGKICTVESVKAASDVYSPLAGEVIEVNSKLENDPETVNGDPFGEGWFVKLKVTDTAPLAGLMDAAAYAKYCEER